MNDPGVDAPIHEAADDLERNPYEHQQKQEEKEEQDFLDPSRWWFASTAAPLIAGTFGPMASAFSICALVQYWREYIPPGGIEAHGLSIQDPPWLTAINSISLIMALTANMALLLNMAQRLSFAIAQGITIVGWLLSSFLLVALVSVASTRSFRLQPAEEHALTQAFYYAIIAAALYCIVSLLMVANVAGAYKGHYDREFRLTISQRTLMLQTIMFMGYLLGGALIFAKVETWEFLDAVYWADFTLLTVGIGSDFVPKTHLGRSLLFPYAIGGIVTLGLVIGSVRSLVLERGKAKMSARMTEKMREKVIKSFDHSERTIKIDWHTTIDFSSKGMEEAERREQEFNIMRKVQSRAEKRRRWVGLGMSSIAALMLWLIGAVVFHAAEYQQGWSYFVSLYFAYTSLLTVGYGDLQPLSNSGKPFFVFWSLLAVPTLTILISNMGDTVVKGFSDLTIWAGSLTILPGENGARATIKASLSKITNGNIFNRNNIRAQKQGGPVSEGENQENEKAEKKNTMEDMAMDRLAGHIEEEELEEAEEAEEEGDTLERDVHFYHYVLARELRNLMKDVEASPPKQYDYNEWAWYLKLVGMDEADSSMHRRPKVGKREEGTNTIAKPDSKENSEGTSENADDKGANEELQDDELMGDDKVKPWSWLGTRSPLMGNKAEAEWMLERLSSTLETELKRMGSKDEKDKKRKPPVSMAEFKSRRGNKGKKEQEETKNSSEEEKKDR